MIEGTRRDIEETQEPEGAPCYECDAFVPKDAIVWLLVWGPEYWSEPEDEPFCRGCAENQDQDAMDMMEQQIASWDRP